jgi:hypothetical protein
MYELESELVSETIRKIEMLFEKQLTEVFEEKRMPKIKNKLPLHRKF